MGAGGAHSIDSIFFLNRSRLFSSWIAGAKNRSATAKSARKTTLGGHDVVTECTLQMEECEFREGVHRVESGRALP